MNKLAPLPPSHSLKLASSRVALNVEWGLGMVERGQMETNNLDRKINQAKEASRAQATRQIRPYAELVPDQVFWGPSARPWGSEWGTAAWRWQALGEASLKRSDEVELLPVLAGEDGGLFVMLHQLVHGVKAPLPDAVDIVHELHLEMLVLPWCFERHGEVTGLGSKQKTRYEWASQETP